MQNSCVLILAYVIYVATTIVTAKSQRTRIHIVFTKVQPTDELVLDDRRQRIQKILGLLNRVRRIAFESIYCVAISHFMIPEKFEFSCHAEMIRQQLVKQLSSDQRTVQD